jgi:hypothetical protein
VLFAGSFIGSCLLWTQAFKWAFGAVEGAELTLTWVIATFGSWFLLVIPFMRKKEQIWKRLNDDQERAVDIWLLTMGLFIAALVAAALLWSWVFRGAIGDPGFNGGWAKAVFGSWLVVLLPFLVFMYKQADNLFTTAQARQGEPRFRTAFVERERRLLPPSLAGRLKGVKPTLPNGHLVAITLKSGERIPAVFVAQGEEILGIYDRPSFDFSAQDIVDLELSSEKDLALSFQEEKWLRLDFTSH